MASKPGILTDWPWKSLGSFKYVILAPWVLHTVYTSMTKDGKEIDSVYVLFFPFLLWRVLHNQIWISLSRYRTAKGNNRIVDKSIEFEQVDRESNWDDQILLNGLLFYIVYMILPGVMQMPFWRTDGVLLTILLHAGPVEFLYYWLHRALHHHYLYSRYHSHHHSSIVTEPITSVIHPFAEHLAYFLLFSIPILAGIFMGRSSIAAIFGYISYIDFMNNMGHCNFELIPKMLFSIFPALKYLMYTPSFHSLHHTQFRTNYSLFMPIYDYIYGTMDKSVDALYEKSLIRPEELPHVVHLTHLVTPQSIYHLRLGFASLASKPYTSKWYVWVMWPVTYFYMMLSWPYSGTFVLERNQFHKLNAQMWVVPKFKRQYLKKMRNESINNLIEEAILKADERGVKVLSLGLLNQASYICFTYITYIPKGTIQVLFRSNLTKVAYFIASALCQMGTKGDRLNCYGELYIRRNPNLKIKVVDGTSLAVAIVLNSIPKGTIQVLFRGNLTKVAYFIASALCQMGTKVATSHKDEYEKLNKELKNIEPESESVLSKSYTDKVWLVGDGLTKEEQLKASKGTLFIPFSQFPPKRLRKDCFYYTTPAMMSPKSFQNVDSCENWLPRRAMSASRVAGVIHALEGWDVDECGNTIFDLQKIWEASLHHGFRPLPIPT